ncbi:hypothetical protein D9623_20530 [Azospirillum brasilense]|uniref:DUF2161 family putative PD-(D/E)XK-type phosphodiesterase n=1 Tax=Azospirillum brasilense TaxID=192 RepID=A0A0N7I8K3_AZOBR|nr:MULTISPECIES: DUF2161 family putative PD-(D/E)XK-type phosphodiesterase [Azospirillum]ALJ37531.1 hypothetical protein AMK58_18955 [Azospirillum brasilense]MDW7553726.1 DUF2161 family putative PD-(D/E)XK-type phosphodiesterase [Azospirillum brasilense]MDW7592835.1 DUF2161 family putative PD-(D/E)XK-type phosphodiesterase [Azospirillum brasilense]MDW7628366.1 DUF2161 family putative PD-(D/E)XK-type phosphodiesterase [Azospirillum brasilense]MDX5952305.1 DUF2161 family putative PD-(D/E)XK-type
MPITAETDLYAPVKAFLEAQGYDVKAEIHGCDLVAVRGAEPPLIVELKKRFTLDLLLQGVDRLALTDIVYLAVPQPGRKASGASPYDSGVRKLCRRLGVGLLIVDTGRAAGHEVEVLLDPVPYSPRKDRTRAARLLGEHARRRGDPNRGGSTRVPIVTAYRQDALRCARMLQAGPLSLKALRAAGAPKDAAAILQRNVYGWFERIAKGTYGLTEAGVQGVETFAHALAAE